MTTMLSRTYDEKRDFIRMRVDSEVTISLDNTNNKISGYCRDLSGTGMLLEVNEAVKEGTVCKTTLASNNNAFPSLDASVKVLRCSKLGDNVYQLGTEIVQIES